MAEENKNLEETATSCTRSKCCCGKLLCLKGLANIYKVLSILVFILMIGLIIWAWVDVFRGESVVNGLLATLQIVIYYGFPALVLITISRILKTLRKIKHAVEHR